MMSEEETQLQAALEAFGLVSNEQMMQAVDSVEHIIATQFPAAEIPVKR